jgi:hypothetical protein
VTRDLLIIVPSRGRPANIDRLADAFDTATHADLLVAVDDDDPELAGYMRIADRRGGKWDIGQRRRLVGTLNHVATNPARTSDYRYLGFMGDDHWPRTPGWDREYVHALDRVGAGGIVYGDDLIQGSKLPTQVALDKRIVDTLGYMAPPGLVHMFADNFWRDLGLHLGTLRYLPDVVVEHLHPIASRAAWDDRYAEVNAPAVMETDHATYDRYLAEEMLDAVARIKGALLT